MANKTVMPPWGPYSKKYMGISKILENLKSEGARLDVTVHPTLWNSATPVPNVTVPSSYHLWQCTPDYSYYAYRYELMWKDMVYANVSFSKINDDAYLIRCSYHNNTHLKQNCLLNIFASLEFPFPTYADIDAPEKCVIKNANDYAEYTYATPRPWDEETPDGLFKGMFRDSDFYLGEGLGDRCRNDQVHFLHLQPFGAQAGDRVAYTLQADGFLQPQLYLRYRTVTDGDAQFDYNGEVITLPHSEELTLITLPYKENPVFESLGTAGVEFDFLAVTEAGAPLTVTKKYHRVRPAVTIEDRGVLHRAHLKYEYDDCTLCIMTHNNNTRYRSFESGSLEDALINRLSNGDRNYDDLTETFSASFERKHSDEGFVHNTLVRSLFLEPYSTYKEYAVVSSKPIPEMSAEEYERIYLAASEKCQKSGFNRAGQRYTLSTDILKATLLTNVVYPVYLHGDYVIHHTPGKRWDSFYTWDSGFIGLGLLEISRDLCQYALDMYLTDGGNKDFAFLLHGSLVPTQFAEYLELLKRTEDKHSLDFLYDKLKLYYEFLQGRTHGSTCDKFKNGLLTVYDYWYSCSGMDDYPVQLKMMEDKAQAYTCACLPTAQIIRAGKIMKMVAAYLGKDEDIAVYDADIARSAAALNTLAWDEESGYFGYTLYDKDTPYLMKTDTGENWDKGFDGVYPLVAGVVEGKRRERLISHLKNPGEMWSDAGISAVDMSASYYEEDGYWNGNVWMSHQWFMWKTMLDNGDADFAFAIADRALEMWKAETDFSYYTYECFGIQTRRGGWFHNFGGLSAPICIWANAYYKPGTVTTGLDVWTDYQNADETGAEVKFRYFGNSDKYTILVTLRDDRAYTATLYGAPAAFSVRRSGCLEFTFDGDVKEGLLIIK